MDFINFINVPLTPKESNFIGQVGADLLIETGEVPSNNKILKEIINRAMYKKKQSCEECVWYKMNGGTCKGTTDMCNQFISEQKEYNTDI